MFLFEHLLAFDSKRKVNWIKTLLLNFRMFSFFDAIKLSVVCYGPVKIVIQKGAEIELRNKKKGALKVGYDLAAYRSCGTTVLKLFKDSKLCIDGESILMQGSTVLVGPKATLTLNNHSTLGDRAEIICRRSITIGKYSEITWDCQVTDYASHPIEDITTGLYNNIYRPVFIGDYCWIGNRTSIQPGTIIPDRTMVASNSLLNKDYVSAGLQSYSLIGGIPARVLKNNIKRNYEKDHLIQSFFFCHLEQKQAEEKDFEIDEAK